ncbi:sodium:proton antiporter [Francisellaceae bacterium]|nr:sodium:proton antiporter [Francisellaceae bacterium]
MEYVSHYSLFVLLSVITASASFINFRILKLPKSIGLTLISAVISLIIFASIRYYPETFSPIYKLLDSVNFKEVVLKGMLGYLLFASAMHLSIVDLKTHYKGIAALASIGVIISTFIIGTAGWLLTPIILNAEAPYSVCLLIGAIISPTDPIAVFAVFKKNKNIPTKTKTHIAGEALFNDVASIVLFIILVTITFGDDGVKPTFTNIALITAQEGLGGILLGVALGYIGNWFMNQADDGETQIILSLALVSSGFWLAETLGVSGPLAMVITGLIIGNSRSRSPSSRASIKLSDFWLIIDDLLNAFLFVMIGMEILETRFSVALMIAGIVGFIVTVITRYISVSLPMLIIERRVSRETFKNNIVMTWGGLRGSVSLALALSIPYHNNSYLSTTFSIVYITVMLSILIQGATFKTLLNKIYGSDTNAPSQKEPEPQV